MNAEQDWMFEAIATQGNDFDIEDAIHHHNVSVHEENASGCSILAFALLHHATDVANKLILFGADVDVIARNGETPLTELCYEDETYSVEIMLLVNEGACIEQENAHGMKPLMAATMGNNAPHIRTLIELGADPNGFSERRPHPIIFAVDGKHWVALRTLLQMGADVNVSWHNHETPLLRSLHYNTDSNDMDTYMPILLAAGADISVNEFSFSPFLRSVLNRNGHWAHELLAMGCHICHQQPTKMPKKIAQQLDMTNEPTMTDQLNCLLFASGEQYVIEHDTFQQPHRIVLEMLHDQKVISLKALARQKIRTHMIALGVNLFHQVQCLPITHVAKNILLYR